ncbi:hypothetical protein [Paracoccus sulfuroxidans]|uniref:Uncharacterized protein n=1 Tax=Paracoccus sulfuroxidans TaxID=384678 RepID=A0A562NRU4_9RHOB|nr:hypothetical protein [Paracoccus sulfuroxidans]TWI34919.1 hypothetical protein IQ24_01427 [Paracoccus sulfuroxidans]
MPVATATITGPVFDQTGAPPFDATIEFRLRSNPRDLSGAVLRGSTVVKVGPAGAFSTVLYAADGGSTYDVIQRHHPYLGADLVEQDIGPIRVTGGETRWLAALLPVKIATGASDTHRIKRGDSLSIAGVWLDEFGVPIPSAGVGIASALLGPDGVTRAITSRWQAGVGEFELSMAAGTTAQLPIGTHQIDIKFSTGARVLRTMTGRVIVGQEITP